MDTGIKVESREKLARYLSGMSDGDRDVFEEQYRWPKTRTTHANGAMPGSLPLTHRTRCLNSSGDHPRDVPGSIADPGRSG